jgi:hypothetical protein
LKGMYTQDVPLDSNGQPIDARHNLTSAQAEALRAKAVQPPRPSSPVPVVCARPRTGKAPKKPGKKTAPRPRKRVNTR